MFEKLKDLYEDNLIRDFFRNVKYGIRNFWRWKSIIWNDKNFDHYFFFIILHKKLSEMYKSFSKNNVYVGQDKDAKNIKICINLLNRILEKNGFDYSEKIFKNHAKKWGWTDWCTEECEDGSGNCRLVMTRPKVKNKEDKEKERKEFMKCMKHEDYMRKQDVEYLFKIINKQVFKWWI